MKGVIQVKEFKSSDIILNSIYEEFVRDSTKYERAYVSGILTGALIYSYATDKISHSEFTEILVIIREMIK
jgi:hypothetical protein